MNVTDEMVYAAIDGFNEAAGDGELLLTSLRDKFRMKHALADAITALSNQGEGSRDPLLWLEQEVHALDCRHHGDPSYDHDAYWMKREVLKLVGKCQTLHPAEADRRDAERLDYMVHRGANIDCYKGAWTEATVYRVTAFGSILTEWHDSYREAIDAAIAATQEQA